MFGRRFPPLAPAWALARPRPRGFATAAPRHAAYNRFGPRPGAPPRAVLARWLYSRNAVYVGVAAAAVCAYNLERAPVTGRVRLLWVPHWLERKIGDYSYRQILAQYRHQLVPPSDPAYARVSRVMNRLLEAAAARGSAPSALGGGPGGAAGAGAPGALGGAAWQIHIVNAPAEPPNAFILPNGKIFIFSSILPVCRDDDGLATVLSHELSHQLARHTAEQLSKQPLYLALSVALYAATGVDWLSDVVVNGALRMPASREMETEADRIGCDLMARSCFSLGEAVRFWQRMEQWEQRAASPGALVEFFSTHPGTPRRIANIEHWMPELRQTQEASGCFEHHFGSFRGAVRDYFK
ncbi:Peptidase M48 domain-containing protein [[Candida] zeylanoides]